MNKNLLLAASLILALFSCTSETKKTENDTDSSKSQTETQKPAITLKKIWESDTLFTTSESVIYDEANDVIYVSNIEGEPWKEDGKGSIGKLSADGKVINAKWVEGLNAPKGLGIVKDKLYVTDNIRLVEIDLKSGKILKKYEAKDCKGLNDITTTDEGLVYFTDSEKGQLYLLKNGEVSLVAKDLKGSNGVFYESDRLLLGTWEDSSLTAYNFKDQKLQTIAKNLPQPDGIEAIGDGSYLVSSWSGLIHLVDKNGKTTLILDTQKDKISSADIDFVPKKNLLLIPTFFRNTVAAYELVK